MSSGTYNTMSVLYAVAWFLGAGLLLYMASLDVAHEVQLVWSILAIGSMLILRKMLFVRTKSSYRPLCYYKMIILILSGVIALRYMWWRTFHSLPLDGDLGTMIAGFLLYFAEIQALLIFFMSSVVYLYPLMREVVKADVDGEAELPSVDVFVPTFNEPPELIKLTLLATGNMRYPADKLNIYLLDDGGTVEKRQQKDPDLSAHAWGRYHELQALCEELGVNYMAREKNNDAKAGNINAALPKTSGELVLILDCDHVPTVDFLENTVVPFQKDEKLYLVQTPHFLINEDPVEKNVGHRTDMPSECELFYTSTMRGMDNWNSAFFCGSGGLLRRSCLEEVGGIGTRTVTEDIETSIQLARRGYNSAYIHKPMLAGLQPESFSGFMTQRLRWAHGMLQVFMMMNPLVIRGLSPTQRLCYFNMVSYWFFSFMRLVFLLAPSLYLLFGFALYDAPVHEVLLYGVPHLIAFVLYFNVFFGRVRWFLVSEMYETLQSMFSIRTIFKVLLHPQNGKFNVTPKDENIDEEFMTPLAAPYFILITMIILSVAVGLFRMFSGEPNWEFLVMATFWSSLSLLIVIGSFGALYEKKQVRHSTRFDVELDASLAFEGAAEPCLIKEMSATGANLCMSSEAAEKLEEKSLLNVYCEPLGRNIELNFRVCSRRVGDDTCEGDAKAAVGIVFTPSSLQEQRDLVALSYGDSERWRSILKARNVHPGLWHGFMYFCSSGIRSGFGVIGISIYRFLTMEIKFKRVLGAKD